VFHFGYLYREKAVVVSNHCTIKQTKKKRKETFASEQKTRFPVCSCMSLLVPENPKKVTNLHIKFDFLLSLTEGTSHVHEYFVLFTSAWIMPLWHEMP